MRYVVDASSVVAYLLGEGSDVERDVMLGDVHAPRLLDVEATQALRGLLRGKRIDLVRAESSRAELSQLGVHRHPDERLLRRAWELRDTCTTYDALYVALTEALGATLMTRDVRLAHGVSRYVEVSVAP